MPSGSVSVAVPKGADGKCVIEGFLEREECSVFRFGPREVDPDDIGARSRIRVDGPVEGRAPVEASAHILEAIEPCMHITIVVVVDKI